jgi:hypothetical protein
MLAAARVLLDKVGAMQMCFAFGSAENEALSEELVDQKI